MTVLDILLDVAWKSVVTLGATLALLRLLKRRSAAERAWVVHLGLITTILLPLAVTFLPRWEMAASAPVTDITRPMTAFFQEFPGIDGSARSAAAAPMEQSPAPPQMNDSRLSELLSLLTIPATLIALLYGLPATLLLSALVMAVSRLYALRTRASVVDDDWWLAALAVAGRRMNLNKRVSLLVSEEIRSPVSWGMLRPVLLLNRDAMAQRDDAEAIIAHELAHVERGDWSNLLLARTVTALFWFNPLVWLVASQAHQLREEAADDVVLRSDIDCHAYAALLVSTARRESRWFMLASNGVAADGRSLKRRIIRILDERQMRAPAYRNWIGICVLVAAGLGFPLAALSAAGAATGPATQRASLARQADTPTADGQPAGTGGVAKHTSVRVSYVGPQQNGPTAPGADTSAKPSDTTTGPSPVMAGHPGEGAPIGAEQIGRREFAWDGGQTLSVSDGMIVRVRRDGPARVVVTGPVELVERVFLRHGHLGLENKWNFWGDGSSGEILRVEISGASLDNVTVSASSEIALGTLQQDSLTVRIDGSGSVTADGRVNRLDALVSASGNLRLPGMQAREGRLSVSGSGSIAVRAVDSADLSVSGSGHISTRTIQTADVSVPGSGQVLIEDRPRELTQSISGTGRLVAGGETYTKSR